MRVYKINGNSCVFDFEFGIVHRKNLLKLKG